MLKTQAIVVDTLHDMQRFLTDHATEVGPGIEVARGTLDTTVANIETHLVEQDAGVRNALGATQKLRPFRSRRDGRPQGPALVSACPDYACR